MEKKKKPYLKHKLSFLFDADFPIEIIKKFKNKKSWKKRFNFKSVHEIGKSNANDKYHFSFCKKNGYIFVTLDTDFINDTKHPFSHIPGIMKILAEN
jgi:predicted nuclease of predicted toxin-antitoxin system